MAEQPQNITVPANIVKFCHRQVQIQSILDAQRELRAKERVVIAKIRKILKHEKREIQSWFHNHDSCKFKDNLASYSCKIRTQKRKRQNIDLAEAVDVINRALICNQGSVLDTVALEMVSGQITTGLAKNIKPDLVDDLATVSVSIRRNKSVVDKFKSKVNNKNLLSILKKLVQEEKEEGEISDDEDDNDEEDDEDDEEDNEDDEDDEDDEGESLGENDTDDEENDDIETQEDRDFIDNSTDESKKKQRVE